MGITVNSTSQSISSPSPLPQETSRHRLPARERIRGGTEGVDTGTWKVALPFLLS